MGLWGQIKKTLFGESPKTTNPLMGSGTQQTVASGLSQLLEMLGGQAMSGPGYSSYFAPQGFGGQFFGGPWSSGYLSGAAPYTPGQNLQDYFGAAQQAGQYPFTMGQLSGFNQFAPGQGYPTRDPSSIFGGGRGGIFGQSPYMSGFYKPSPEQASSMVAGMSPYEQQALSGMSQLPGGWGGQYQNILNRLGGMQAPQAITGAGMFGQGHGGFGGGMSAFRDPSNYLGGMSSPFGSPSRGMFGQGRGGQSDLLNMTMLEPNYTPEQRTILNQEYRAKNADPGYQSWRQERARTPQGTEDWNRLMEQGKQWKDSRGKFQEEIRLADLSRMQGGYGGMIPDWNTLRSQKITNDPASVMRGSTDPNSILNRMLGNIGSMQGLQRNLQNLPIQPLQSSGAGGLLGLTPGDWTQAGLRGIQGAAGTDFGARRGLLGQFGNLPMGATPGEQIGQQALSGIAGGGQIGGQNPALQAYLNPMRQLWQQDTQRGLQSLQHGLSGTGSLRSSPGAQAQADFLERSNLQQQSQEANLAMQMAQGDLGRQMQAIGMMPEYAGSQFGRGLQGLQAQLGALGPMESMPWEQAMQRGQLLSQLGGNPMAQALQAAQAQLGGGQSIMNQFLGMGGQQADMLNQLLGGQMGYEQQAWNQRLGQTGMNQNLMNSMLSGLQGGGGMQNAMLQNLMQYGALPRELQQGGMDLAYSDWMKQMQQQQTQIGMFTDLIRALMGGQQQTPGSTGLVGALAPFAGLLGK